MFKGSLKWIAIFSIAVNLLVIVPALHMLQIYDRVLSSNSLETLIYISLIAIGAMILFGIAEAVRGVLAQRASAKYTVEVADPLFSRLAASNGRVQSSSYLRDFNNVRSFISSRTLVGLFDLPFTPFFLLLMFLLHWTLGVVTVVGMVLLAAVAWLNKTMTAEKSEQAKQFDVGALTFAQSVFSRSEDIRAMGLLPSIMERWGTQMGMSLRASDEAASQASAFYGTSKAVRKVLQILIMAWGAYLVINGVISGGVIFAASMISGRALGPIEQVIGGWDRIAMARDADKNIKELLAQSDGDEDKIRLPEPAGHISVENLVWNPHEEGSGPPILDGISFDLEAGKTLAIIGPSGAGKSTVAKAIVGALNLDEGQVRLDGAERSQWPEDQWGESVGYVSQEITLFPATLAENIARLETRPDERRVVAAAQAAGVHEMITRLNDGYGTVIGPGKIMLSGGQKQRIALARALYTNPRVLVLDEPNAHLDAEGEESLVQALERAKAQGRTIIIITQRRSVLRAADYVLTIRNGKVDAYVAANFDDQGKQRSGPKTVTAKTQRIPVQSPRSEKRERSSKASAATAESVGGSAGLGESV
ncbi:type I secretion system permease/ATPase [Pseudahrensia aquimaris]|uniref:Type I secretion system permease/ATPase n=1 Tax=Pseudahrensia aquimaris TaxID=744461 RepID=A0ABW3FD98_9HYPH